MITELLELADLGGPQAADALAAAVLRMETPYLDDVEQAPWAERLARRLGSAELEMRARLLVARAALGRGDLAAAHRIVDRVCVWAADRGHDDVLARGHRGMYNIQLRFGDHALVLEHAVQCVAHTRATLPPAVRTYHLLSLGNALGVNGFLDEEHRCYTEALAIASEADDAYAQAEAINNLAYAAYESGDVAEAVRRAEQMRGLTSRSGITLRTVWLDTIARIEIMRGDFAAAELVLSPALVDRPRDLPDLVERPEALVTLAEAQRLAGNLDRAQATLDHAVAWCVRYGVPAWRPAVRAEQATLHATAGRYDLAYAEHVRFHAESEAQRSAERVASAQALHVRYEADEARRAGAFFRDLALRDPLTGLPNRRFVNEQFDQLLARHAVVSVALVDLDHFKRINDQLSHDSGDAVLVAVSRLLAGGVGEPAFAARLGGEEFLLVLPDHDRDAAVAACERIRAAVRAHAWEPLTGDLPVTASIGVATASGSTAGLLARADARLYDAKRAGRDRVAA